MDVGAGVWGEYPGPIGFHETKSAIVAPGRMSDAGRFSVLIVPTS